MIRKLRRWFSLPLVLVWLAIPVYAQEEPPLPSGLDDGGSSIQAEPALPKGLGAIEDEESALPAGLSEGLADYPDTGETGIAPDVPFELNGFWEVRGGVRTQPDSQEKDASIGEARLKLELEQHWADIGLKLTTDFLYDPVLDRHDIRLEEGQGWLDLREAFLALTPIDFMDLKAGRQILTWGTGDLIFINDLFPKDWNSFFIGRDPEYLKAPSDAVKVSLYSRLANLDVVYTPRFDTDRFIDGGRISYFNSSLGRLAGRDEILKADEPDDWFRDDEIALRLFKNVNGYELAAYAYRGFWKSPGGMDPVSGMVIFPQLSVYGASVRGNVAQGIGNIELGYYDSEDDSDGDDPLVRNSEFRLLLGYEQELVTDFTAAVQYYLEQVLDYGAYRRSLPTGSPAADEYRHVITLRLTRQLMNQNLKLSLFTFYSPSDKDVYLRPNIHYKINDNWSAEIGGNTFWGEDDHTFFGQFEKNSNVYVGVRYGF
jgi:hypothetical protein